MTAPIGKPKFFESAAAFRAWLEANHDKRTEVFVGLYKRASGKRNMSWSESVDEALCFGWIDGIGRSLGEDAFMIRFTPRRPGSIWSAINVAKIAKLEQEGRLHASGRAAFALRKAERTGVYSFERAEPAELSPKLEKTLKANRAAARFFENQPPGYRRVVLHWIVSAKKEETQERRLAQLIEASAAGRRLGQFVSPAAKKKTRASGRDT
jgi:uncharacterized protein YdeI (YjbR/CyaY-like superfamily)